MEYRNLYVQYMYSYPHKTAYRPLEGVDLKDYSDRLAGPGHGLYFHIPFCQSKCGYCNLFSVTGMDNQVMEKYLEAVGRQICQYREILAEEGTVFSDFTIGGGTPLLLEERFLEKMFDMTDQYLEFDRDRQVIIETAPNQTTREKLGLLKARGVTRVSMGIQSFQEQELKVLGRGHDGRKARKALELLKAFEFSAVNVDFIYGIPGQTTESLLRTLKEAVTFQTEEIFLYPLYVKHGVSLEREGMVLDQRQAYGQYKEAAGYLRSEGYRQDSMRRFVKTRHGGDRGREFSDCGFSASLALGCGGRSYVGNLHFCTPYAITREGCLKELRAFMGKNGYTAVTHGIFLSREEEKRRYVIRHVLIRPGLNQVRYRQKFGTDVRRDFPLLSQWMDQGFLEERVLSDVRYLTLTEEGLGLSDCLGPELISPEIHKKMEEWDDAHQKDHGSLQGQFKKL
ncbi:MAG: coproporphyrinogen III oxidase family protein [Hungatella sp.]|nr:coproporphyrinogen III oxidase family protein [Hungatella sp.]